MSSMGNVCSTGDYEEKIRRLEEELEENNQNMQALVNEITLIKRENKYFKKRIDNIMLPDSTRT